jgi:hypothetical protein
LIICSSICIEVAAEAISRSLSIDYFCCHHKWQAPPTMTVFAFLLYTILILVLILMAVKSYSDPTAIWVTKLMRTIMSQCIVLQQHVESIDILCVQATFFSMSLWIWLPKDHFRIPLQVLPRIYMLFQISAFSAFGIAWSMHGKFSWMYGRKRNWPWIRMMHHIKLFGLTPIQSWHWDLIAWSTCPCYIALDGSSRNAWSCWET